MRETADVYAHIDHFKTLFLETALFFFSEVSVIFPEFKCTQLRRLLMTGRIPIELTSQ